MSDYLDQIEWRAEDALRNREMYSKDSRRITQESSAKDVPRLLAAIRAVERLVGEAPQGVRFRSDWEDGRAALAQEIRVAITDALEGERMSAVCVACGRVRTTEQDYHPIQVFTGGPFGWFSGDSEEMCPECFTKLMRKANG